jgi:hypothetical protein
MTTNARVLLPANPLSLLTASIIVPSPASARVPLPADCLSLLPASTLVLLRLTHQHLLLGHQADPAVSGLLGLLLGHHTEPVVVVPMSLTQCPPSP